MLRERWLGGRRARVFTLQWHLTQACGNACTHCYDRTARPALRRPEAALVLDDLVGFCRDRGVAAGVTFTGGDPLLHPDFLGIYADAAARGLSLTVLGNPTSRAQLEAVAEVRRPRCWQVSLEGLQAENDAVRGAGSFERTLAFLDELRRLEIPAHVMLTLTRDNAHDLLPLAGALRGRVDRFTFNRLARVGEGAALASLSREAFAALAEAWVEAARRERHLGLKDGLLSLALGAHGRAPGLGCTGAGCGAAFNFVALLPDGEVHACRKLPSPASAACR
ncbi:MAG: thio(seleno)oxazole modification radical SAM maturase SbtM [Anaeromyxobacter sp.]